MVRLPQFVVHRIVGRAGVEYSRLDIDSLSLGLFTASGFCLCTSGILMILAGALWTFLYGVEGVIVFAEGETVHRYIVPKEDKIVAVRQDRSGRSRQYGRRLDFHARSDGLDRESRHWISNPITASG